MRFRYRELLESLVKPTPAFFLRELLITYYFYIEEDFVRSLTSIMSTATNQEMEIIKYMFETGWIYVHIHC